MEEQSLLYIDAPLDVQLVYSLAGAVCHQRINTVLHRSRVTPWKVTAWDLLGKTGTLQDRTTNAKWHSKTPEKADVSNEHLSQGQPKRVTFWTSELEENE